MKESVSEDIETLAQALCHTHPSEEGKIPLRPPCKYKKLAKVAFSPLLGEKPKPLPQLTQKDLDALQDLPVDVEVFFGKTSLSLKELAALEEGSLLPLEDLCDDLVEININGIKIGRGEIVMVDGHYGVRIVSFTKN